jgi:hypothetical protein
MCHRDTIERLRPNDRRTSLRTRSVFGYPMTVKPASAMRRDLLVEIAIYVSSIVLASLLWRAPYLLAVGFLLVSVFALYRWHTRSDLLVYLIGFILGPTGEAVAVYFGAWQYSKPLFLIPIWLPFLWGITALFLKRLAETLAKGV